MSTPAPSSAANVSFQRPPDEGGGGGGGGANAPDSTLNPSLLQSTPPSAWERALEFGRIFVMSAIIVGDICGNSLVILSVCRHSKLRVTTNWFVVSLACADILVALFAMTFNASVIISGRWLFSPWVCDFWNSCDVLASTASILHLCCISIDRYIAITRPLDYPMKITTRRVAYALCGVWVASALLSYIPIFTGVYTTAEHIKWLEENPDQCDFVVNRVYAVVSSSISFWIPSSIMVFTYYRIYKEATRQEKFIYRAQNMMPAPQPNHSSSSGNHAHSTGSSAARHAHRAKQRRSKSLAACQQESGGVARVKQQRNASKQQQQRRVSPPPPSSKQQQQHRTQAGGQLLQTTQLNAALAASIPTIDQPAAATPSPQAAGQATPLEAPAQSAERASSLVQLAGSPLEAPEAQPLTSPSASQSGGGGGGSEIAVTQRRGVAFPSAEKAPSSVCAARRPPESGADEEEESAEEESNSGQSTPTKRSISKMKREHKAAKTLGIIMGVFILCWLPFFSWYTPQHICGHACDGIVPRGAVTILFWIGYFNSTLNPIIYAYFNHEFRDAFKKTLQWIFCCCEDLKCLRVTRPNDNQHYNCTYRSTQEIGLVSNS